MLFKSFKKEIIRKIDNMYLDVKKITNETVYLISLEVIKNVHLTDAFLLSEFGGFDKWEITQIKKRALN